MEEFKDHQQSELELYRRELLNKDGYIEILENNVKELQEQLKNAYVNIKNIKENDTGNPEIWHYYDRGSHLKFVDGKLVADLIQLEFDI